MNKEISENTLTRHSISDVSINLKNRLENNMCLGVYFIVDRIVSSCVSNSVQHSTKFTIMSPVTESLRKEFNII